MTVASLLSVLMVAYTVLRLCTVYLGESVLREWGSLLGSWYARCLGLATVLLGRVVLVQNWGPQLCSWLTRWLTVVRGR